ncbi:MAG: type II toxin-antitoxin system VapC family toxin [Candidatus Microthrix subdominans]
MIVLDASATVDLVAKRRAWREIRAELSASPGWLVPGHWMVECLSALRRLERSDVADRADEYERGVDHLDRLRVEVHAVSALELWERRHNLKVADAGYVALAERFSIPLVTSDARLTRAPGTTCEFRSFAVDRP